MEGRPLIPRGCGLDPFPPGAASSAGRPPPRPAFGCGLSCLALGSSRSSCPCQPLHPFMGLPGLRWHHSCSFFIQRAQAPQGPLLLVTGSEAAFAVTLTPAHLT